MNQTQGCTKDKKMTLFKQEQQICRVKLSWTGSSKNKIHSEKCTKSNKKGLFLQALLPNNYTWYRLIRYFQDKMLAGNVLSRKAFPLKQKSCCTEIMNNMACPAASDFLSQTTCAHLCACQQSDYRWKQQCTSHFAIARTVITLESQY